MSWLIGNLAVGFPYIFLKFISISGASLNHLEVDFVLKSGFTALLFCGFSGNPVKNISLHLILLNNSSILHLKLFE